VAPLKLEDLEVIQAVRFGVEGFAARTGAPAMSDDHATEMARLFTHCQSIAATGSLDEILETQWAMHEVCYRASGRDTLLTVIRQYRRRAERYVRLAVTDRASEQLQFQKRFVDACCRRNGDAAEAALTEALTWTITALRPILELTESD
jgi:DNA-binding GntR family transcriptional regulator